MEFGTEIVWGFPDACRDSRTIPGLLPLEQVFSDIDSESVDSDGLVSPCIAAPSPGYSPDMNLAIYANGPSPGNTNYRRVGRIIVELAELDNRVSTFVKTMKKEEVKVEGGFYPTCEGSVVRIY